MIGKHLAQYIVSGRPGDAVVTSLAPVGPTVWAPPLLSILVIVGFIGALGFIVSERFDLSADTAKLQIVNIVIGALTAGFATVLNFWLGSSQGSKNKDLANFSLQHIEAMQAGRQQAAGQTPAAQPTAAQPTAAPTTAAPSATPAATESTSATPVAQAAAPIFHATRPSERLATADTSAPTVAPQRKAAAKGTPTAHAAPAKHTVKATAAPAAPVTEHQKDAAFQECVAFVLKNEGGFVDNPEDPGGATNMGITIGTLRAWRGQPVTVEDVRNLSQDEAISIYRANYWNPLKCDELPLGVDMVVFDFGVNAGIRRSAMTLQQVVGVTEDGVIGPETLAAVSKQAPAKVVDSFGAARLAYYKQLKEWPEFGKGWTDREAASQSEARSLMSQSVASA